MITHKIRRTQRIKTHQIIIRTPIRKQHNNKTQNNNNTNDQKKTTNNDNT